MATKKGSEYNPNINYPPNTTEINILNEEVPKERGKHFNILSQEDRRMTKKGDSIVDAIMEGMTDIEGEDMFDVTDVLEEVINPSEGVFAGGKPGFGALTYYALGMPQGTGIGNIAFDSKMFDLLGSALTSNDNKTIEEAQRYLKQIGYYDDDVDGLRGNKTIGAINRYLYNFQNENFKQDLNDIKDSVLEYIGF
tara:strand:- start:547 stop:1131 length:585 start_codon:yes stop_codon:yes gene_type:complete